MKNYESEILLRIRKNKSETIEKITDDLIREYVELDNKLSRALSNNTLSEYELNELELNVLREKTFLVSYFLMSYGYNIKTINGVNQWYKENND